MQGDGHAAGGVGPATPGDKIPSNRRRKGSVFRPKASGNRHSSIADVLISLVVTVVVRVSRLDRGVPLKPSTGDRRSQISLQDVRSSYSPSSGRTTPVLTTALVWASIESALDPPGGWTFGAASLQLCGSITSLRIPDIDRGPEAILPPAFNTCSNAFLVYFQVKILPTTICFNEGVAVHNIIGFDGLTAGLPAEKLDEWPLSNLARELALAKVCRWIV